MAGRSEALIGGNSNWRGRTAGSFVGFHAAAALDAAAQD